MPREEKFGTPLAEIVTYAIKDSHPRDTQEKATEDEITTLRTKVKMLLSQGGRKYPVSGSDDTYGYIIHDVPKELIPKDTLAFLHPDKAIHMEVSSDYKGGETSIIFRQKFNVPSLSSLSINTVTYNLSGKGNRTVQQATSTYAGPYEIALNPQHPDQRSFLSRRAVAQLADALDHPQLQPKPPIRRA